MSDKKTGTLAGPITKSPAKEGTYGVTLHGFVGAMWEKRKADISETLNLKIESIGLQGAAVTIQMMEKDLNSPGYQIDSIKTTISGDSMTVPWKFPGDKVKGMKAYKRPKTPSYYFIVTKDGNATMCRFISDTAALTGTLKISLVDDKGAGVGNATFNITFGNKTFKNNQKTPSSGNYELKNMPLGEHTVVFTNNPLITTGKPVVLESPLKSPTFPVSMFEENKFFSGLTVVKCSHKVGEKYRYLVDPAEYSVVEARKNMKTEPDTVSIYTNKEYNFTYNNIALVKQKESLFTRYDLACSHPESGDLFPLIHAKYWTWFNKEKKYQVAGGPKPLSINVYPTHQYALSLSFPTPAPFEGGAKLLGKKIEKFEDEKIKPLIPKIFKERPKQPDLGKWAVLDHPLAIMSTDKSVAFTIDNQETTISVLDAIGSIITWYKKINSLITLLKDNIPEAGFYFEFTNKFFEGKMGLAWGWKEYQDHRAFVGIAASIDLTLISISLEIGVGFKICQVVGQIYISLAGEIKVSAALERVSPDNLVEFSVPINVTIDGTFGARVKVGTFLKGDALITSGIGFSGKFVTNVESGATFSADAKFSGAKIKFAVSGGVGKIGGNSKPTGQSVEGFKSGKEWVWLEESPLGKFAWPTEEKFKPDFIPNHEIAEIFEKNFTEWYNVEVYDAVGIEIDRAAIINMLVTMIDAKKDLKRSKEVIEAIAHKVRVDLKNFNQKVCDAHGVPFDKFNKYRKAEFVEILKKNTDQSLQLMNLAKKTP